MKKNSHDRPPVELINSLVGSISSNDVNHVEGIYLDESLSEFMLLENRITVPSIPAAELDYGTGYMITGILKDCIPEFLTGHVLLEKRKPSAEQHSLHFIKPLPGRILDFVHVLRLDLKFSANYGTISARGDSRMFPSYTTDMVRYKSRLVPVVKGSRPEEIDSLKLKSSLDVDTDGKRFTSVFFDEFSTAEISIDFSTKAGSDIYPIPSKIYPFISYDYFTACLNVPDPYEKRLACAAEIFEPLFLYLYFIYRESGHQISGEGLGEWSELLGTDSSGVAQRSRLHEKLKDYFSEYSLYRDDDLMLKGWRKITTGR